MSDSFMTPDHVYQSCEDAYGRPALDPCWHPKSPIRPRFAYCKHLRPGEYQHRGVTVVVVGMNGLVPWSEYARIGWFWLNPPYSDPALWLRKLELYPSTVSLIKSDHTTQWWDDSVSRCSLGTKALGLFRDRLSYPDAEEMTDPSTALFPSALVVKGLDHRKISLRRIAWFTEWDCV